MTVVLSNLWLAIFLAAIACWVASAIIHMLIKYHNADYSELENEDEVIAALGASSPKPALYSMPYCIDMSKMNDEAMQKKFNDGPVAMIAVLANGMPPLGKLLTQQLLHFLFGIILIGWLATLSLDAGAAFATVFCWVFIATFLAFGWAEIPYSIWMGQPWSNCLRFIIDAAIYGAVTAAIFAWLWP